MEQYKQRKINIINMEAQLENLNNYTQTKESEIEKLLSEWLPKLKNLVGLLNTNFSRFLTSFGCDGLIELDTGVTRVNIGYAFSFIIKFILNGGL